MLRYTFSDLEQFVESVPLASPEVVNVCFVTSELAELHQNGGIGTATSGLIRALRLAGARITVFYTGYVPGLNADEDLNRHAEIGAYIRSGVEIEFLQLAYPPRFRETRRKISYACFDFIKNRNFDVVHFNDYGGNGYYSCIAKKTGTSLRGTTLITTVHGPTLWASTTDQLPLSSASQYEDVFLEHESISNSDVCVGVSSHILQWLHDRGVTLPVNTFLHKNCHPEVKVRPRMALEPFSTDRVVFFGRMDRRKGLDLFVKAVERFAARHPGIKVCFIGKYSLVEGEHSAGYILRRLGHLRNNIEIISGLDRDAALTELSTSGTLVVIPSHDENSPCVVVECQMAGIPFIAADVGGIGELISPDDRDRNLFTCSAEALEKKLEMIWERGLAPTDPVRTNEEISRVWVEYHHVLKLQQGQVLNSENMQQQPLVSICITHYRRPHLLAALLDAIEGQTYPNVEVVLVDDGSEDNIAKETLNSLRYRKISGRQVVVIEIQNSYLGAARNAAASASRGEYLKFQDDDNLPTPGEIASMLTAAQTTGSDIVTCFAYQFSDEIPSDPSCSDVHYFPLGNAGALAYLRNEFGDANALIKRTVFEELGGFTEDRDVGCEDYELFAKAVSSGYKLTCVPEPLFYYRVSPHSMLQTNNTVDNALRAKRGFAEESASFFRTLAELEWGRGVIQEQNELAWYRSSKYPHAALHQQLLEGDPNAKEKHRVIAELLSACGHIEDAISYSVRNSIFSDALDWINLRVPEAISDRNRENGARGFPVVLDLRFETDARLISPARNELPLSWHPDWDLISPRDKGLLVHPVGRLETIASLPSAVGRGAVGATVRWCQTHPDGPATEVSIGIGSPGNAIWSQWHAVYPKSGSVEVSLDFDPLERTGDLLLRTKAINSDENAWVVAQLAIIVF